jgi:hypothetical protein
MRIFAATLALALVTAASAYAMDEALTEQQIEGVQKTIKGMGCTVEDTEIEMEKDGYEVDNVICKDDKQFEVDLDKDFKVTKKEEYD